MRLRGGRNVIWSARQRGGAAIRRPQSGKLGRKTWGLAADLSVRDAVQSLADGAEEAAGEIGILVTTPARSGEARQLTTLEDWDYVLRPISIASSCPRIGRSMVLRAQHRSPSPRESSHCRAFRIVPALLRGSRSRPRLLRPHQRATAPPSRTDRSAASPTSFCRVS